MLAFIFWVYTVGCVWWANDPGLCLMGQWAMWVTLSEGPKLAEMTREKEREDMRGI